MIWLVLILITLMLAAAVAVLASPSFIGAVAASSVVSFSLALLFILLKAPDVAMTEATIGAGLSALVFAFGLKKLDLIRIQS